MIAELLELDPELQETVTKWSGSVELKRRITSSKMTPLQEIGAHTVAVGKTTLAELAQVIDLSSTKMGLTE